VPHIYWRRIKDRMEVLQVSEIKHGHAQALCILISRLIGVISQLGSGLVD